MVTVKRGGLGHYAPNNILPKSLGRSGVPPAGSAFLCAVDARSLPHPPYTNLR